MAQAQDTSLSPKTDCSLSTQTLPEDHIRKYLNLIAIDNSCESGYFDHEGVAAQTVLKNISVSRLKTLKETAAEKWKSKINRLEVAAQTAWKNISVSRLKTLKETEAENEALKSKINLLDEENSKLVKMNLQLRDTAGQDEALREFLELFSSDDVSETGVSERVQHSEAYWKDLAEERRRGLKFVLAENKKFYSRLEHLREEYCELEQKDASFKDTEAALEALKQYWPDYLVSEEYARFTEGGSENSRADDVSQIEEPSLTYWKDIADARGRNVSDGQKENKRLRFRSEELTGMNHELKQKILFLEDLIAIAKAFKANLEVVPSDDENTEVVESDSTDVCGGVPETVQPSETYWMDLAEKRREALEEKVTERRELCFRIEELTRVNSEFPQKFSILERFSATVKAVLESMEGDISDEEDTGVEERKG